MLKYIISIDDGGTMRRIVTLIIITLLMISAMLGCLNTKITKARIPKHDKLDDWR